MASWHRHRTATHAQSRLRLGQRVLRLASHPRRGKLTRGCAIPGEGLSANPPCPHVRRVQLDCFGISAAHVAAVRGSILDPICLENSTVLVLHPRSPLSSFSRSVRLFPHQTSGSRSCCPKGHEQRGCVSRSPSGNMTCKSTLYKVFCESGLSRRSSLAADQELAGSPLPQFAFAQGVRNDFSTFSAASKPGWSSAYTENQTSAMLPSFNAT